MDDKESSFMGLVGLMDKLRGEKKLLFEEENLDSVFKSISTWSPASILNLKLWILKMRAPQAKCFEFLKSCISKCENGGRMNWPPPNKYNTPHRASPPLKFNIFSTCQKPQNSKILTTPPKLREGALYIIDS